MADKRQTSLVAELSSLPAIRAFIEEVCLEALISDEVCYDVKLAVEEACTNIIEHGGQGEKSGRLILSVQKRAKAVIVRVTDFGRPFEPKEPPMPSAEMALESGKIGGFGLYFIYRLMDEVTYETGAAGNTLTMIKRLDGA